MLWVPWHDMQAFLHLATIYLSSWSFYAYVLPTKPNWLPFLTQGTLLALCLWKSCLYSLHSSSPQILLLICQEPAQMPQPVWSFSVCSKLTVTLWGGTCLALWLLWHGFVMCFSSRCLSSPFRDWGSCGCAASTFTFFIILYGTQMLRNVCWMKQRMMDLAHEFIWSRPRCDIGEGGEMSRRL